MSTEFTPSSKAEFEARLTALLLGEITGAEAAALRQAIEADPELTALYERLKKTVTLVREVAATPAEPAAAHTAPLKLSEERRQKLLAQFKTVKPKEFAKPPKRVVSPTVRLLELAAVLALLAVLAGLLLPSLAKSKSKATNVAIVARLRQLDGAKQTWALENHAAPDAVPTFKDIEPYMGRGGDSGLQSYAGEKYIIGRVDQSPVAVGGGAKPKVYSLDEDGKISVSGNYSLQEGTKLAQVDEAQNDVLRRLQDRRKTENAAGSIASESKSRSSQPRAYLPSENTQPAPSAPPTANNFKFGTWSSEHTTPQAATSPTAQLSYNTQPIDATPSAPASKPLNGDPDWIGGLNEKQVVRTTNYFVGSYSGNNQLADGSVQQYSVTPQASPVVPPPVKMDGLSSAQVTTESGGSALAEPQSVTLNSVTILGNAAAKGIPVPNSSLAVEPPTSGEIQKRNAGAFDDKNQQVLDDSLKLALPPLAPTPSATPMAQLPESAESWKDSEGSSTRKAPMDNRRGAELLMDLSRAEKKVPASTDDERAQGQSLAMLYRDKKSELEQLTKSRDVMATRALQQTVEAVMPHTMMSSVIQHAQPEPSSPTLGERITSIVGGKVERHATIKLEHDVTDVPSVGGQSTLAGVYDPYFVQTQSEVIESEPVLDRVISKLKLDESWADNVSGNKLDIAEARRMLKSRLDLKPEKSTSLLDIGAKGKTPEEAAQIANAVAEAYDDYIREQRNEKTLKRTKQEGQQIAQLDAQIHEKQAQLNELGKRIELLNEQPEKADAPLPKSAVPAPIPQPEVLTSSNAFSTFSLNIADVSFKLAAASLEKGVLPEPASIRSEEFINAFDYRDPEAPPGVPVAFAWERARYPFAQNRDLLRFSLKTAATGRAAGRPLNIVLLLDNSGSMERADRVQIIHEALRVLAGQLQPQDTLSIVTFARTARLFVDGVPGNQAADVVEKVSGLTPQGGTNLEEAMRLAYETALRHYLANGVNRVVLLTDGAANLGNLNPTALKKNVEAHRKQGIALDCFGIGWEDYNDDLLEVLARNGDGRYGFLNSAEETANGFARQLVGALDVAAADVKVQVEFNPRRVTVYRQIGYAKLQLTKEQFRDNTVDAAEIGAAEAGNALYVLQADSNGEGPLCTVRVRYKIPGTEEFHEHEWTVPYTGSAVALEQSTPAMRLAATASAFSEWLANSPYATEVTPNGLLKYMSGVSETFQPDARPKKLEWMLRQAAGLSGK